MDTEKILQAFLGYLRGVENLELCWESNDSEDDQTYHKNYTPDGKLITEFLKSYRKD